MSRTIPLAKYIFTRLRQCGVSSIHGVPGDFTLKTLDYLKDSGQKWVGSCNELNAGYAADGYARIRGLGALFTTYGVGELSAINAVAGSFAEHVPVVHIVGLPQRHFIKNGLPFHHSLGDGRTRVFAEMYKNITVAQAFLDDEATAAEAFDQTLEECLKCSRPVYIELPADIIPAEVDATRLDHPVKKSITNHVAAVQKHTLKLLNRIKNAERPLILVDRGDGMDSLRNEINHFVEQSGIPTLTLPSGASMVDHSISNYFGVHAGPVGQIDSSIYTDSADLVIALGPMFSDTQTIGWKVVPSSSKTVTIGRNTIKYNGGEANEIDARALLDSLSHAAQWEGEHMFDVQRPSLGNFRSIQPPAITDLASPIDQTTLYLHLNSYLRPDDTILLANATPIIGGRDFVLPSPTCRVLASGMWFSVGHMLPAAQGAALAQQEVNGFSAGRTILFDGDGSFQMTAQELSTIIRLKLNVTIFIINNSGYAYERQIHGMDEAYNDIVPWNYLDLPKAFGGVATDDYSIDTFRIETWGDLGNFLADERFDNGAGGRAKRGLKIVDVVVGKYDVPEKFEHVFQAAREQSLGAPSVN